MKSLTETLMFLALSCFLRLMMLDISQAMEVYWWGMVVLDSVSLLAMMLRIWVISMSL